MNFGPRCGLMDMTQLHADAEVRMSRTTRIGAAVGVGILLAALAASIVLAQEELLGGKLRTGESITVGADESVDGDLYVIAGTVVVNGSVDGDLTVFGGQLTLNGPVTGDVLAAGGTVSIAGDVTGDVRVSGGQVTLNGPVGEDVVAAGGQTQIQGGASIEGDLVVSGGQVSMDGAVAGNIEANAGVYNRSGTVGGTENVTQGEQGSGAVEQPTATDKVLDAVRHFVVLLLIGAALLWLLPRLLPSSASKLQERPGASLGWGVATFVGYIVFVIIAVILIVLLAIVFGLAQLGALVAIDIFGGILGIFVVTFGFAVAVGFVADLVVGFGLARMVGRSAETSFWQRLAWLAAGVAVVVIVTSLPIIGGIAKLLVVLFGLGALYLAARSGWRGRDAGSDAAPPAVATGI